MVALIVSLISASITALLGVLVLYGARKSYIKHFALVCLLATAWVLGNLAFSLGIAQFFMALICYGIALALVLEIYLFSISFTKPDTDKKAINKLQATGWLLALFSIIPGVIAYGVKQGVVLTNTFPLLLYGAILLVLIMLTIVNFIKAKRTARGVSKRQIDTIILGVSIAACIGAIFNLFLPIMGDYGYSNLGPTGLTFFTLMTFFAITRYQLFNIKLTIIRTFGYLLSVLSLIAVYLLAIYLISNIFSESAKDVDNKYSSLINILLVLVLSLIFQPIKHFFDRVTDKIFYRGGYSTNEFIMQLGRILANADDLPKMLDDVSSEIRGTLKTGSSLFLVYRGHHPNEMKAVGLNSNFTEKELQRLHDTKTSKKRDVLIVQKLEGSNEKCDREIYSILSKKEIYLAMPLSISEDIIGYFMLGEKLSGDYTKQDIEALEAVANEMTIAVQNIRSIQEVKELNANLEQRIESATKELRESNQKLIELDEAKDEFMSMASHQLRTPLTSVKGYISMVLEGDAGDISPMQEKILQEAFMSSERMVHLISDFLNISRLQTGRFVIEKTLVNLADLISGEVVGLQTTAKAHNLKLRFRKPTYFPALYLDGGKFQQVVMNFIDNAIYYSSENTTIEVKLKIEDGDAVLEVHDTGIGVPKSEQARLFTKFFRATNAKRQRPDGTGIGLFLAKKVITSHDGKVIFRSAEGEGSVFGFRLPIRKLSALSEGSKRPDS